MSTLSRAFVLVMGVILLGGTVILGIARHRVNHSFADVPPSPITRATSPDEIARGGRLFRTLCLDCHAGAGGTRPTGARVKNAPEFIGEVWAPNITADPQAGVGAWTDGELARLLRNGVRRDLYYAATMPRFPHLGDDDVSAILGFMRSDDPMVQATPAPATVVPRSKLGIGGVLALAFAAGVDVSGAVHVDQPPRGPNAPYGRYLAARIYACVDCHTNGFGATDEKLAASGVMAGGMILHNAKGDTIYSRNLTADAETGLAAWSADDLTRALTSGLARDGRKLRPPMPVFRAMDATDAAAIYAFLRSVPAVRSPVPITTTPPHD
ncbi:MAG TPA: cytochrome c [Polyangia bacterium]|jgi:mono/diheme cytochrome c family protein